MHHHNIYILKQYFLCSFFYLICSKKNYQTNNLWKIYLGKRYLILSPFCCKCTHLISELEIVEFEIVKYFLLNLSFILFFPQTFIYINSSFKSQLSVWSQTFRPHCMCFWLLFAFNNCFWFI